MYFIARNNKVYSYLASIKPSHRYLITTIIVASIIGISFYGIYSPLHTYTTFLQLERDNLQKQYSEQNSLQQHNKNLAETITNAENTITTHTTQTLQKKLSFIIDAVKQCGLTLHAYSIVNEKNKEWYTKETVHISATGSNEQCIAFITQIKKAEKLISISRFNLQCDAVTCKLDCDIACIAIKNPSTLNKLKG